MVGYTINMDRKREEEIKREEKKFISWIAQREIQKIFNAQKKMEVRNEKAA